MPDNTTSNPTAPGDLPIAALLRMAADGEILTHEQQSLVDAYCRENADKPCCKKFEQALRKRVGMIMGDAPAAPEALCAAVRKLASTHAAPEALPEPIVRSDVSFWLQQRWVPMAMAECTKFLAGDHVWHGPFGHPTEDVHGFLTCQPCVDKHHAVWQAKQEKT